MPCYSSVHTAFRIEPVLVRSIDADCADTGKGEIKADFRVVNLKKLVEAQKFNPSFRTILKFEILKYLPKTNKNERENLTATKF